MTTQPITMSGKYQTRDGQPARILCVDALGERPVVALVGDCPYLFYPKGAACRGSIDRHLDLVLVPVTHEIDVWVNVFADGATSVFISREYADASYARQDVRGVKRVACVHIKRTVTEGEGL